MKKPRLSKRQHKLYQDAYSASKSLIDKIGRLKANVMGHLNMADYIRRDDALEIIRQHEASTPADKTANRSTSISDSGDARGSGSLPEGVPVSDTLIGATYITATNSPDEAPYIKIGFNSLSDMHSAHDKLINGVYQSEISINEDDLVFRIARVLGKAFDEDYEPWEPEAKQIVDSLRPYLRAPKPVSVSQPDEERIAYHERGFDEMKDIFLLESLRCAGLNNCEPALWMGLCRSAMKRLSKREAVEDKMNEREKFLYKMRKQALRSDDMDYCGNLFGFRKEERTAQPPLIELYIEDDGWWHYQCCFSAFWLSDLKHFAQVALSEIEEGK